MITQTQEQLDQLAKNDLQTQYDDLVTFSKHTLTLHFGKNTLSLRLNSPNTQNAISRLGFDPASLSNVRLYRDFADKEPDIQDLRYKHYLRKLQQKVKEVIEERRQVMKKGGVRDKEDQHYFSDRQVEQIVNTQNYIRSSATNPNLLRYEQINHIQDDNIDEFDYQLNYQVEKFNRYKHQKQLEAAQVLSGMGRVSAIVIQRKHKQVQYIQQQIRHENQRIEQLKIKQEIRDIKSQKLQEIEAIEKAKLEEKKMALEKKLADFNNKIEIEKQELLRTTQLKIQKKKESQQRIRENVEREQQRTLAKQEQFMTSINEKMESGQRQFDRRIQSIRDKCQQHQHKVGSVVDHSRDQLKAHNQHSLESVHKKISQTNQGLKNLQDYRAKKKKEKLALEEIQRQVKLEKKLAMAEEFNQRSTSAQVKQEQTSKHLAKFKQEKEASRLFNEEKRRLIEQDKQEMEQILMTRFENKQARLKDKFKRSQQQIDYQRNQKQVIQQTNAEAQKQIKRDKAQLEKGIQQIQAIQHQNQIRNKTLPGEYRFLAEDKAKGKLLIKSLLQENIPIGGDLFAEKAPKVAEKKAMNKSQLNMDKSQVSM